MRRALGLTTALVGIAALALSATPVAAATLPAGDQVYLLPCDDEEYDGILYSVDTTTGVATRVGDWVNPDSTVYTCAGPAAYDPVTGLGYWIAWEGPEAYLISVDLTTGVNTNIGQFTIEGEPYYTPIAIAIDGEGNAWATSWNQTPDVLFTLDLTTAALTEVGPTGTTPTSGNFGLAWDPVTRLVYAYNTYTQDFYAVNTATGAFTLYNDDVLTDITPYAIAFDSAGQVWGVDQDIISAPLTDLDASEVLEVINPYTDPEDEGNVYSESIIIAPAPVVAPQLAATGSDNSATAVFGFAGALLLIAGIVIARRRPRTA
ncbi:LPXTG cell wall anchor domain-containing protein [Schumannella luteola]